VLTLTCMKSIVLAPLLSLVACDDSGGERAQNNENDWFGGGSGSDWCPEATCSDTTPNGLHFYGEEISQHDWLSDLIIEGPQPTAAGGHQRVRITGLNGASFEAVTDGTSGIAVDSVDQNSDSVVLRGTGNGSNYLRILDPSDHSLYDRKLLDGAAVENISLQPIEWERSNGQPWAFKGVSKVAVALHGHVVDNGTSYLARLVDSTMTMQLPTGVTRAAWDAISIPLAASQQTIVVQAGDGAPVSVDLTVVDHIDRIEPYQIPTTMAQGQLLQFCFHGIANDRPVAGLAWTFTLNDVTAGGLAKNCVLVGQASVGPLDIAAMTEGFRATVHVNVVDGTPRVAPTQRRTISSEGELAATLP
jgi:hypothetical protein